MTGNRVAIRYGKALIALAEEKKSIQSVNDDLAFIASVIDGNDELMNILENPVIPESRKLAVCLDLFSRNVSDLVVRFIRFLGNKNRLSILAHVCKEFSALYKEKLNIVEAEVTTAVPLQEKQKKGITDFLVRKTGKKVVLKEETEPSILGGFSVRIGDDVYDNTLQRSLHRISKSLKSEM